MNRKGYGIGSLMDFEFKYIIVRIMSYRAEATWCQYIEMVI